MLEIHRAERADTLADALAQVLRTPLADPFTTEVVAVPAKGVERWLHQRLSGVLGVGSEGSGDGVAAGIEFPSPSRLVDDVVSTVGGIDPAEDPWSADRSTWSVLRAIDDCTAEPWCAVLAASIGAAADPDDHRRGRRWSVAAHVAGLLRTYAAQRPAMLRDWAAGVDTDGAGGALPDDLRWQAEIFRRVRSDLGAHPAERLQAVCEQVRRDPSLVTLPERLSVFGPTRLTTTQRELLHALAGHRTVHLWLPHPSPALWDAASSIVPGSRRRDAPAAAAGGHPLLVGLARDVRELRPLVAPLADRDHYLPSVDEAGADTVLRRLQRDLVADRAPTPAGAALPDGSVEVHACHGPARQVDVLRDVLLRAFQDDPTLEPRDVLIMCPDVESFAPLVRAAFGGAVVAGRASEHPAHSLRVRLADRGLRRTNPVLEVVATMIELGTARVTAGQMLDVAALSAVRARFRFTDDDLERVRDWVRESGARWGIDSVQRSAFGLRDFEQNTFTAALDRLLLGAAADESTGEWLGLALPVDDVDGGDIELVGRFAELVDRVSKVLHGLRGARPADQWRDHLLLTTDLLCDVRPVDEWIRADARRELAAAFDGAGTVPLRSADVRALLGARLAGRPTRSNFRTGELTVCTMVPMRSVPHRVVVLLGLDDDVFPRAGHVDGDDVLARDPLVGERDVRSEDRQLLLDAVMAATDRLLLFHTGANPITGVVEPPAIPLADVIDAVTATAGRSPVIRHPLQPFDPASFAAAAPRSFDPAALDGARALQRPSAPAPPFLSGALAPTPVEDVDLTELLAFVRNPIGAFLRQRLQVRADITEDEIEDALSVRLPPLAKWALGDRMLAQMLAGVDAGRIRAAEWRRGSLPPHHQGARELQGIEYVVGELFRAAAPVHVGAPETVDVLVDLGDGRRLTGSVPGIHGTTVARARYSTLSAAHRLEAWLYLVVLTAHDPSPGWTAVTTGRTENRATRQVLRPPDSAADVLRNLVDLRDRGLREPLPLTTRAGGLYADRVTRGVREDAALAAAEREFGGFGDGSDAAVRLVHGPAVTFADITADTPRDDERVWSDDSTRFGVLARRLWAPLLAVETLEVP
ncbi:exodeoxyribonuclease V subunit gamma [Rhodococcoides corynebacterioides]|uniref:RecBCD enzyme subunit RecC n=1 Tax=Rhodococcoides corynebacterioides TaxID=53972 RepID=A0ABS7P224_9NOCA|nr:exodeoxyribonuclease V subunit gamma [Rhodococcus corynebacterioides]MBY6366453.1 exodeoxyribonuclease V subunit gamma [Rhodococcus corynebacterioides]MBY6407053.1 exodeoxyribonuclease V subunit gamma [Rhodococcus corynebacterioides]